MTLRRSSVSDDARAETRAQTTIDFAIGVSLFLLVVAVVVAFVPTIFAPFQGVDGSQTADRLSTSLSTDRLGQPSEPYVLNATCTNAFFEQVSTGTDAPTSCRFNTTADTARTAFALPESRSVNVSIRTLDGAVATGADGDPLTAGPSVPQTTSVTSARRAVSFEGDTHRLLVRTW
ncbi:DUF7287 family protein [Halobellus inordinatus]|uniref:DUF7287 family protein n=1 Tax=Halobellus inordinatus TaxID=1126236 RepID=UPI0021140E3F|nr:hypothetical protein [Halobellus ramosii]